MKKKIEKGLVGYMWDGPSKPFPRFIWKLKKRSGLKVHHSGIPIIVSDKVVRDKTTAVYSARKKKTIIGVGNRKPYISLEEALNKIREVKGYGHKYKSGKHKGRVIVYAVLHLPQILIGHKVKLVLIK